MRQFVFLHVTDGNGDVTRIRIPTSNCNAVTWTIENIVQRPAPNTLYACYFYSNRPYFWRINNNTEPWDVRCGNEVDVYSFEARNPAFQDLGNVIRFTGTGFLANLQNATREYQVNYLADGTFLPNGRIVYMRDYCGGFRLELVPLEPEPPGILRLNIFFNNQIFRTKDFEFIKKIEKQCPNDCPPGHRKKLINSNGDFCCCCC